MWSDANKLIDWITPDKLGGYVIRVGFSVRECIVRFLKQLWGAFVQISWMDNSWNEEYTTDFCDPDHSSIPFLSHNQEQQCMSKHWMKYLYILVMWSETIAVLGQDRSETKIIGLGLAGLILFCDFVIWKHDLVTLVVILVSKNTATFKFFL